MKKILFTLAPAFAGLSAGAQNFYYYENEDGTLTITHADERWHGPEGNQHLGTCHSYTGDIVIPEEIDGKTVTAIGKDAFYRCDITSVKLPNTLKLIDEKAFLECPNVKELTIPASVDSIGNYAFNSWDALEQVTIEDSPNVLHAGRGGSSVMSSMFSDQPLLKKAYVGRNHICPTVGASMDYEINLFARSHVEEITFGDYVTEIQKHELLGCKSLKKVNLSKNITSIGDIAFDGCELLSEIEIPDGVEEIGRRAFNDCFVMPGLKLPSKLRIIGQEAFRNCVALTSVTIPASVQSIGMSAFTWCIGVTSLKLEDSPNAIQLPCRVFDDFRNLKTLYIGRNYIAEYDWYGNFISNHPTLEETTVAGYATEIQNQMFNGCAVLKKVTLGDKITRIGIDAFTGCSILEDINLPARLEKIDTRAFRRCYALKDPKFPTSLKEIGEEAYGECSIENIHIPASVEKIYYNAFGGTKLGDIYCYGTVPPVCTDWLFHNISKDKMTLHYPKGSRDDYKAAVCWKEFFDDYAVEFDDAYVDPNSGGEGTGDGTEFIVHLKAGGTVGYALASKPKVTLSGDVFTVTTTDNTATYQHSEVEKFTLNVISTAISQPIAEAAGEPQIIRQVGQLTFTGCKPNAAIRIYSTDGKLLLTSQTDANGYAEVQTSQLPKGIYVVKSDNVTIKIAKR